jgi:hypothetical protein
LQNPTILQRPRDKVLGKSAAEGHRHRAKLREFCRARIYNRRKTKSILGGRLSKSRAALEGFLNFDC